MFRRFLATSAKGVIVFAMSCAWAPAQYPTLRQVEHTHWTLHNDGLWNNTRVAILIDLPPKFLQSWYFRTSLGVLAVAALRLLYLRRVRQETLKVRTRLYERFSERERIARELHDTLFQGIQGLLLSVQSASRQLPDGDATKSVLEETLAQSDGVMMQGRELVFTLRARSCDTNDLGSQLDVAAKEFAQHHRSEFRFTVRGEARTLNTHVCEELSDLGREALCDAYRHANARLIELTLDYRSDSLRLTISDDGIGIDSTLVDGGIRNHWSMPRMKERAASIGATLRIISSSGTGTIIQLQIPSHRAYTSPAHGRIKKLLRRLKAREPED